MKVLLITLLLFTSLKTLARGERTLARNPRGLLMGGAFTALADDQYSLFYNPALLARHSGFSFFPLNVSITGLNPLSSDLDPDSFNTDPGEIAEAALGIPFHIGYNWAPGFKMGRFGLSAINSLNTNLMLQNKISPTLEIDHRIDKGFIAGYALPLFGHFKTGGVGEQLSMGVSIKYLQREGIDESHYLYGTTLLDALGSGDIAEVLSNLGQARGQGWGSDVGFDYIKSTGTNTFSMGLAILDLGTKLITEDNDTNSTVQSQPTQINLGSAWTSKLASGLDFTLSADIRQLESTDVEFLRRLHLGAEFGLTPAFSLLLGLNAADNYSYGVKLNAGIIKIFAGIYGTEIGEKLGQMDSDRFAIYLSLFHFNFNP